MVIYHAPSHALFYRWIHDLDVFYAGRSRDHFTFRFDPTDRLDPILGPAKLEQEMDDWRWLHAPSPSLPIVLQLNLSTPVIRGHPGSTVVDSLTALSRPLLGVLTIREVPAERPRGEVSVTADDIVVRLYGGGGASIHRSLSEAQSRGRRKRTQTQKSTRHPPARRRTSDGVDSPNEVAGDVLAAVAMALQHAGHVETAAAVAAAAIEHATVSRNPEVV